jgi:DNA polymerase (family 10)
MGPTKEANILRGIDRYRKRSNRIPLGIAEPIVEETVAFLRLLPGISNLTVAGSYRRGRETVGDVDILATSKDPAPIINAFSKMPIVEEVLAEGPTKSSVIVKDTVQVDLRIVDPRSYGTVVQYFTGSKEHNVRLRGIALQKGYSLSEYSMKRLVDSKELYFDKEEDVYGFLGLPFIPPELREDEGEIEAAISGRLPKLVELSEIKGDLHVHTSWSDGSGSLQEMAQAVKMNGMQYFAACDHSPSIGIAGGLSEEKLLQKIDEIDRLNSSNEDFLILSGTEVDIRADGSLDYPNRILAKCDVVVASIHMAQGQSEREINGRLISAIENEFVDIIAHPTGRIIGARDPYQVDMQAVLDAAARTETIMEINAHPARLDLDDRWSRKAMEMGIRLVVNTDAHAPDHLSVMKYGVKVARRAWIEKKDVVNTMNLEQIRDFFLG